MARFRRFRWIYFTLEEELELDVLALLQAEVKTRSKSKPTVSSLLTGEKYTCELEHLAVLVQVLVDKWVSEEEIANELSIEPRLLEKWAQQGLLLSDSSDPILSRLRERACVLSSQQWHPNAALFHFMLRGPDTRDTTSDFDYQEIAKTAGERALNFVKRHGSPPTACYSRSGEVKVDLPRVKKEGSLYDALLRRRSSRAFDYSRSLAHEDLTTLLYYVFGFHGYTRLCPEVTLLHRTSPSGGSLHPIEAYPLLIRVEGIAPGLYHYDSCHHSLELILEVDPEEAQSMASRFAGGQTHAGSAAAVIIMTARFHRNFWKYRRSDRTYTVTLMDAAHLSQTFYLIAADLGLAAFFSASIHPQSIEEALSLDGFQEGPIAICACGAPPAEGDDQGLNFEPFIPRQTKV